MLIKKVWGFVLATLAIIATYIGVNQLSNRDGHSDVNYDLGLPKSAGTGGGTRNTEENELQ